MSSALRFLGNAAQAVGARLWGDRAGALRGLAPSARGTSTRVVGAIGVMLATGVVMAQPGPAGADRSITDLVAHATDPGRVREAMARAGEWRTQILIATVDESTDPPTLSRRAFRADAEYFYPASAIKLCAAVGALQRVQQLREQGVAVSARTPLEFHPIIEGEGVESTDDTNTDGGRITIEHEIRKLFIVSDNRAFNRLYDFVGRDDLNDMMTGAGLGSVRIAHRLGVGHTTEQNTRSPRVDLRIDLETPGADRHTIPERVARSTPRNDGVAGLEVGVAEIVGGERLDRPKSFLHSNRISLVDLQDALVMVVRPDVDLGKPGFALTSEHRALLIEAMGLLPRESVNPRYDPEQFPDDWVKFTLPGLRRVVDPERVRVVNKIGLAYGFTTITSAYAIDGRPPDVFVAGTIYTNVDGTLNDDAYEYETVAMPFWADLGEAIARGLLVPSPQAGSPEEAKP